MKKSCQTTLMTKALALSGLCAIIATAASAPSYATPNTAGQTMMDEVNHRAEYNIAREDCANQLGITLPPGPHVSQQLGESDRKQMADCLKQKGFKPRPSPTPATSPKKNSKK